MAVGDGLAGMLAGGDPTAALQLQALQQQNQAQMAQDPQAWRNLGIGGALAHALAGASGPAAVNTVGQIAGQRQGAAGDLVSALASGNPLSYAAANAGTMNPIALSSLAYGPAASAVETGEYPQRTAAAGLQQAMAARQLFEIANLNKLGTLPQAPVAPRGTGVAPVPRTPAAWPQGYTGHYGSAAAGAPAVAPGPLGTQYF